MGLINYTSIEPLLAKAKLNPALLEVLKKYDAAISGLANASRIDSAVIADDVVNGSSSVDHAKLADTATHASSADNATTADSATHAEIADSATNAAHADDADVAIRATYAETAGMAPRKVRVCETPAGVKGKVVKLTDIDEVDGNIITVVFQYTNSSSSITLNGRPVLVISPMDSDTRVPCNLPFPEVIQTRTAYDFLYCARSTKITPYWILLNPTMIYRGTWTPSDGYAMMTAANPGMFIRNGDLVTCTALVTTKAWSDSGSFSGPDLISGLPYKLDSSVPDDLILGYLSNSKSTCNVIAYGGGFHFRISTSDSSKYVWNISTEQTDVTVCLQYMAKSSPEHIDIV